MAGTITYNGTNIENIYYNNCKIKTLIFNDKLLKNEDILYKQLENATASNAYGNCGIASIGDYALVAGGDYAVKTVDCYNSSLTKQSGVEDLTYPRGFFRASSTSKYAMFVGGYPTGTGEIYDSSLTKVSNSINIPKLDNSTSCSFNDCVLVGGNGNTNLWRVDNSGTVTIMDNSPMKMKDTSIGSSSKYAIIIGNSDYANVYDTSYVKTQLIGRSDYVEFAKNECTNVNNYILIPGSNYTTLLAVDDNLTQTVINFPAVYYVAANNINNLGVFIGGTTGILTTFNSSLTKVIDKKSPFAEWTNSCNLNDKFIICLTKSRLVYAFYPN